MLSVPRRNREVVIREHDRKNTVRAYVLNLQWMLPELSAYLAPVCFGHFARQRVQVLGRQQVERA